MGVPLHSGRDGEADGGSATRSPRWTRLRVIRAGVWITDGLFPSGPGARLPGTPNTLRNARASRQVCDLLRRFADRPRDGPDGRRPRGRGAVGRLLTSTACDVRPVRALTEPVTLRSPLVTLQRQVPHSTKRRSHLSGSSGRQASRYRARWRTIICPSMRPLSVPHSARGITGSLRWVGSARVLSVRRGAGATGGVARGDRRGLGRVGDDSGRRRKATALAPDGADGPHQGGRLVRGGRARLRHRAGSAGCAAPRGAGVRRCRGGGLHRLGDGVERFPAHAEGRRVRRPHGRASVAAQAAADVRFVIEQAPLDRHMGGPGVARQLLGMSGWATPRASSQAF